MAISLIGSSISAAGVHPAPSPGSRTGRTEFDSNQEILSQLLTLLLSVSAWPSRPLRVESCQLPTCAHLLRDRPPAPARAAFRSSSSSRETVVGESAKEPPEFPHRLTVSVGHKESHGGGGATGHPVRHSPTAAH